MSSGTDTLVAAMRSLMAREEILAENLANLRTTGYKQQTTSIGTFASALGSAIRDNGYVLPNPSLDDGALGSLATEIGIDAFFIDFGQGPLEQTGRGLDIGLEGDGFLRVRTPEGDFYSRGGALRVDSEGSLLTAEGHRVLGEAGELILPVGDVVIGPDGAIEVDGAPAGRLSVVEFVPGTELVKAGESIYDLSDPQSPPPTPAVSTQVRSGFLESSNVDDVAVMSDMVQVVRVYQACQRMLAAQDQLVGQAVNELGRV